MHKDNKRHPGKALTRRTLLQAAAASAITGSLVSLEVAARPRRRKPMRRGNVNYYYVATSAGEGTRAAGPSSLNGYDDDWLSPENLYPNFRAAYAQWLVAGGNGDVIVLDDGTHNVVDGNTRILCDGDKADALIVDSRSQNRQLCSVVAGEPDRFVVRSQPENIGQPLLFRNITFSAAVVQTDVNSRQIEMSKSSGDVSFEDCTFEGIQWDAPETHSTGALVYQNASSNLAFERCLFANLTISRGSRALVSLKYGLARFTDCEWRDCSNTCTAPGGGRAYITMRVSSSVLFEGGSVHHNHVASILNDSTDGFCENRGTGTFMADDVQVFANTYENANNRVWANIRGGFFSDNAGAISSQAHLLSRCTFYDNVIVAATNRLGGLALARNQGSRVTLVDCVAHNNVGWYGALVYCSAGGAVDVRRCRGYANVGGVRGFDGKEINGISIYLGGGAEDCNVENTLLYGHMDLANGNALYIHNSDSPAVPGPRTVTLTHVALFDNVTDESRAAAKMAATTETLSVVWRNCVFDNAGLANLDVSDTQQVLSVDYQHCFFHRPMTDGVCDNIIGDAPTQRSSSGTVSGTANLNAAGQPTLGSGLLWAGGECAVDEDITGSRYPSPTHIGAHAKPAGYYGDERLG